MGQSALCGIVVSGEILFPLPSSWAKVKEGLNHYSFIRNIVKKEKDVWNGEEVWNPAELFRIV